VEFVAMSIEDLRVIAQRVRTEAEAAGELSTPKAGTARWGVPEAVRVALLEDLASGRSDKSAGAVTEGDPR
jgi:hypothetical protein